VLRGVPLDHLVRAHHFLILVFEDVTVPDIPSGEFAEPADDSDGFSAINVDRVLVTALCRFWRFCAVGATSDYLEVD